MSAKTWTMPDGVYTALATPYRSGELDRQAWERLVRRQVEAGVAGLVPIGSTGEAVTLEVAEREWLVRSCVEIAAGRCPVVVGTGTNSTAATVRNTQLAQAWGADAALVVTPYYNKPQQHGLVGHYRTVARAVDLPLMLYNVPGRTAVNLLPATAAAIATERNVVALKEASGNLEQIEAAIGACDLKVFSGDDGLNFPIYGLGGRGVVSVVSNLLPGTLVRQWRAWEAGEIGRAWWISRALDPVVRMCFLETNPVPVKHLLGLAGLCAAEVRPPLAGVSDEHAATLKRFFAEVLEPLLARDGEEGA